MEKGLLLTSAHCTCSDTKIVYIGCNYRESSDCIPGQTTQEYEIANFVPHPLYDRDIDRSYDVAIIQLNTSITRFHEPNGPLLWNIKEITLDSNEALNDEPLTIVGYGRIEGVDPNNKPYYLQYGNISCVSREICSAELPEGHSEITASMMCGRGQNEENGYGIVTCSGDSGGPWLSDAEIGVQIGITSWGYNGCSESNCQCCVGYPRMAANIADTVVFEWIETVQQNYDFKFLNIANLQIIKSI